MIAHTEKRISSDRNAVGIIENSPAETEKRPTYEKFGYVNFHKIAFKSLDINN